MEIIEETTFYEDFLQHLRLYHECCIHEAGHAVAIIQAGWRFSYIEVGDGGGSVVFNYALDPFHSGEFAKEGWMDENDIYRQNCIRWALAGAVAERLLVEEPVRPWRALPSVTDIEKLTVVGHYPYLLEELVEYYYSDDSERQRDTVTDLFNQIIADDLPMVERFVSENAAAINLVANFLKEETPHGQVTYDMIMEQCGSELADSLAGRA